MGDPHTDDALARRAATLHAASVVIDAHSDILMGLTDGTCGWEDGQPERPTDSGCDRQVSLRLLGEGGVTSQVFAVFTAPFDVDYRIVRPEYAAATLPRALAMLATFHEGLARYPDRLRLTTTAAEIRRAKADGVVAGILGIEGLDPMGHDLRLLRLFRSLGVTTVSLTWSNRNPLADGSSTAARPGGLTPLGEEVVAELERLRMLIDLAHLGPTATEEVLERATKPLFVSHTRLRDDAWARTLRRVGEGGGVACAIFYKVPTVAVLVDQIEQLIELCGPRGVGLGADFYGTVHAPAEVQTVAGFPRITEELLRRGHDDDVVQGILGENVLRLYGEVVG
ncbi:MAG TPA: membrane dipeptidase [Thermomicrobiaceae bacterium]|nr:membrane dipeptidase [Thermomicrobiaceae bacterium]